MPEINEARDFSAADISAGQTHEFIYDVTLESILGFAELSGDYNPLHCDAAYAVSRGYRGPVAHGAFQQALVSQAIGMWVIGRRGLISSMSTKFLRPLIYPARVRINSRVSHWSSEQALGRVVTQISHADDSSVYSESRIDVGFQSSPAKEIAAARPNECAHSPAPIRKTIVITGAFGGIFRQLLPSLNELYDVVAIVRKNPSFPEADEHLTASRSFKIVPFDLLKEPQQVIDGLNSAVECRPVWALIHAAGLTPAKNDLLSWDLAGFRNEMEMNGFVSITLANWLRRHVDTTGGRMVLIGSNYAIHHRPEKPLLQYGVGKSLLSLTGRALALELAANKITVNTVSPDFVAAGMNAGHNERYLKMKEAENPMKRLCSPADILNQILWLLDEKSGFLTGQDIVLSGGVL